jgi:riboflavin kinase
LKEISKDLRWYLEDQELKIINLEGTVVSGLFQGAYYMSKEGYRTQIQEKIGFDPYLGTLNVRIKNKDVELRRRIEKEPSIRIEGFKESDRAFGACNCYPLILNNNIKGALIVAERTNHDINILEIISPIYLRRKLGLSDGDTIRITYKPLRRSYS